MKASAGAVVFHDAWPKTWPKIQVYITNSHHQNYYQADVAKGTVPPPGDWESPVPVYYPSVKPGVVFAFAVAPRLGGTDAKLLDLARQWLIGALTHLGAGAKTVRSYGCFEVDTTEADKQAIEKCNKVARRAEETYTLQLVTPAFLAGASQKAEDCDLRASTLRGQLRWWWRTMHAAHLSPCELRMLEDALWGSTKSSGAIAVRVEADKRLDPMMFNFRDPENRFKPEKRFKQQHRLGDTGHKETQGLFYASYGMDEKDKQRYVMPDGATCKLTITTRGCEAPSRKMGADDVMQIARNSLALLT